MHRNLSPTLLLALAIVLISALAVWAGEAPVPAPVTPSPSVAAPAAPGSSTAPSAPPAAAAPAAPEAAPAGPNPAAAPEPQPVITSIQVVGNVHIPTPDIMAVIGAKVGQVYTEQQVRQDHDAILALGWFSEVAVDRAATETGIALSYRVTENPVVSGVQFQGNTVIGTALLQSTMQLKPGQVYSYLLMRKDQDRILQLYRAEGYIFAEVWQNMSDQGVLTITVMEGVIEGIRITGNTKTKDKVIRRYVRTKPGDVYNDKCVAADVNRLAATRWFDSVQRSAEIGSEAGKIIVNITVVERKTTGQATVGGGYTSVEGIVAFVNVSKENLWGTGQSVSVQGDFGGISSYEMYYRNPWIMTPETRLNLGLYNREVVREAFVNSPTGQQTVLYNEHRTGGSVTFGRPLSDQTIVYAGLRADPRIPRRSDDRAGSAPDRTGLPAQRRPQHHHRPRQRHARQSRFPALRRVSAALSGIRRVAGRLQQLRQVQR